MGVASGCGEQEAGVASGSGWNLWVWLLGVVVILEPHSAWDRTGGIIVYLKLEFSFGLYNMVASCGLS